MFAIIEIGGQQSKVEKGTIIEIGRIQDKEGSTIQIHEVLLLNDAGKISIGTPLIKGAYVEAKVLKEKRGEKILVFKMKAKKRYRRTIGHRQDLSLIEITDIKATGGTKPEKKVAVKAEPKKATKVDKAAPAPKAKAVAKKPVVKKAPVKKTAKKAA